MYNKYNFWCMAKLFLSYTNHLSSYVHSQRGIIWPLAIFHCVDKLAKEEEKKGKNLEMHNFLFNIFTKPSYCADRCVLMRTIHLH